LKYKGYYNIPRELAMETNKKVVTLRTLSREKPFSYTGSVKCGVILQQSGKPRIDAAFFREALQHFSGMTIYAGVKRDDPPARGFGEWIAQESRHCNSRKLTPQHGSFMAAILCHEAGVDYWLEGNSIVLKFPKKNK
jgi:hypothetical protein